jgi:agmatine deiminase
MVAAARAIHKVTPVLLLVTDEEHFEPYAESFPGEVMIVPTDDCWVRDYGPITTIFNDEVLVLNDFVFNGWGGKFDARNDTAVNQRLWRAQFPEAGYRASSLVLEGGSLESDGQGTLLTTSKCWLGPGRNDWETEAAAGEALAEYIDFDRVLWLHHGELAGDDTDAHVDTLARFTGAEQITYVSCDDPADEHYPELRAMREELEQFRTVEGKAYDLVPLPWPPAVYAKEDGHRLPATYANFLLAADTLFLPVYFSDQPKDHPGRRADRAAADILRERTSYKIVTVDCRSFIEQHGSLHCLTMQIPANP